jgi:molybdopterin synthase catalytic subunit
MKKDPSVSLEGLIAKVKAHHNISKAGMILCHNGIVRDYSRVGGEAVRALSITVDHSAIERVKSWAVSNPGIVAVEIAAFEGDFAVGDDLLYVVLAGDLRENVFAVMKELIDKIKKECVSKKEIMSKS